MVGKRGSARGLADWSDDRERVANDYQKVRSPICSDGRAKLGSEQQIQRMSAKGQERPISWSSLDLRYTLASRSRYIRRSIALLRFLFFRIPAMRAVILGSPRRLWPDCNDAR